MATQVLATEYERAEMDRRARIITGSNNLHRALWREHPRTMSRLFMEGKCEAPRELEIVKVQPIVLEMPPPKPKRESVRVKESPRVGLGQRVVQMAADVFDITYGEVIGTGRAYEFVAARSLVARILRDRSWSMTQIGRLIHRDHSTVINLLDRWPYFEKRFPAARDAYEREQGA